MTDWSAADRSVGARFSFISPRSMRLVPRRFCTISVIRVAVSRMRRVETRAVSLSTKTKIGIRRYVVTRSTFTSTFRPVQRLGSPRKLPLMGAA